MLELALSTQTCRFTYLLSTRNTSTSHPTIDPTIDPHQTHTFTLMAHVPPKAKCRRDTAVAQHVCASSGCLMRCRMTLVGRVLRLCHQASEEYRSAAKNKNDKHHSLKKATKRFSRPYTHFETGTVVRVPTGALAYRLMDSIHRSSGYSSLTH